MSERKWPAHTKIFRKIPTEVKAIQYDGKNTDVLLDIGRHKEVAIGADGLLYLNTPDGYEEIGLGCWLVEDQFGFLHTCREKFFEFIYDEVD